VSDNEFIEGYKAGKEFARRQILDFIEVHYNDQVHITSEDIALEVEYLQRKDLREEKDG
jgi:hypothetical protein